MSYTTFFNLLQDPVVATLGMTLFRSSVLVLLTVVVVRGWRGSSAATRSWLWSLCLVALLLIPLATLLPGRRVSLLPSPAEISASGMVPSASAQTRVETDSTRVDRRELQSGMVQFGGSPELDSTPDRFSQPSLEGWVPQLLFWGWLLGGMFCLSGWVVSYVWSRRLIREARPAPARIRQLLSDLTAGGGSGPGLLLTSELDSPAVAGLGCATVLLPVACLDWSRDRLRWVLLHELAHISRRDCWFQLAGRLACALYWFNPLVWRAYRAMHRERERACDDAVLARGVKASSYAQSLLDVARDVRAQMKRRSVRDSFLEPATIAMAGHKNLEDRLRAILDVTQPRGALSVRLRNVLLLAGLLTIGLLGALDFELRAAPGSTSAVPVSTAEVTAPLVQVRQENSPGQPASSQRPVSGFSSQTRRNSRHQSVSSYTRISHDGSREIFLSEGDRRLEVEVSGDIELSDDDRMVTRLSSDGYLRIRELVRGKPSLSLEILPRNGKGQELEFRFAVDEQVRPFESDGRLWLEDILLEVVRRSGLAAAQRTRRMLRQGGTETVFNEIRQIRSDGVKVLYFKEITNQTDLDEGEWIRLLEQVAGEISSDGDKTRLLIHSLDDLAGETAAVRRSWLESLHSVSSNGDKSRALISALKHFIPDSTLAPIFLQVAGAISSDGDKSRVLLNWIQADPELPLNETFFQMTGTIRSDGDLSRVLLAAVRSSAMERSTRNVIHLLRAARTISSDGDLSRVLIGALQLDLEPEPLAELLHTAQTIGSDGDKARVLVTVTRQHDISGVRELFLAVADTIRSDGEHRRVLRSLRQ